MRGLKVLPSGRPGRGRLYVNLPDGQAVAWYDRQTNRISVLADQHREAVLAALRPYLAGPYTVGPPPVPTPADLRRLALPPDEDLAPNRPGEALLGELEHGSAGSRARHRLRQDLAAQQRMGDLLDSLEPDGWRVLHSVPLPGLGRIDHLLMGPAGIFCIRTLPGRRQRAAVGDLLLTVGRTEPRPDPRWIRRAAAAATRALAAPVLPALALVDASRIEVAPTVRDIRILEPATAPAHLAAAPTTLKPPDIEALFTQARTTQTWLPPHLYGPYRTRRRTAPTGLRSDPRPRRNGA
ncbi:nuclease-related domain-containing protein [Streptomyces sp. NBC_01443]|uniref:nuclease-related domain-containing protein n=1 Tax=Streptomyces sp. NBC_01443 TaxID=2903868 RepID=UPI0022591E2A|nr:nuclease-related domain-containing protein [Streptomyces sp. NBC_01443]MCX4627575.1 NERD domain-containing protein [Streptomyces sp. NBC_01443]